MTPEGSPSLGGSLILTDGHHKQVDAGRSEVPLWLTFFAWKEPAARSPLPGSLQSVVSVPSKAPYRAGRVSCQWTPYCVDFIVASNKVVPPNDSQVGEHSSNNFGLEGIH